MTDQDKLTPQEKKAFEMLAKAENPKPSLEDKVVNMLKDKGLIKREWIRTISYGSLITNIAAGILLLATGYWLGSSPPSKTDPQNHSGQAFMLLLHEEKGSIPVNTEISQEYAQWVGSLFQAGISVTGNELDPTINWEGPSATSFSSDLVSGYFTIKGRNLQEVQKIARNSPHLKYGGSIEIRKIIE